MAPVLGNSRLYPDDRGALDFLAIPARPAWILFPQAAVAVRGAV